MKKFFSNMSLSVAMSALSIMSVVMMETGCSKDDVSTLTGFEVAPSLTMLVGQQDTLELTFTPSGVKPSSLKFTSDNPSVVFVDDKGILTALTEGVANINIVVDDKFIKSTKVSAYEAEGSTFIVQLPHIHYPTTRTTISVDKEEKKVSYQWALGDEISVNGIPFELVEMLEANVAKFRKKNDADPLPVAPYKACYPASSYTTEGVLLPTVQKCKPNLFKYGSPVVEFPMYAEGDDKLLYFKNICGLLEITLNQNLSEPLPVRTIFVTAQQPMSGVFSFKEKKILTSHLPYGWGSDDIELHPATGGNIIPAAYVELDCGEKGVVANSFYVAVPAGKYTSLQYTLVDTYGKTLSQYTEDSRVVELNTLDTTKNPITYGGDEDVEARMKVLYHLLNYMFGDPDWYALNTVGTDEMTYGDNASEEIRRWDQGIISNTSPILEKFWGWAYTYINVANELIGIYSEGEPTSYQRQCVAEARSLRAMVYMYLAQTFGDVPLIENYDPTIFEHLIQENVVDNEALYTFCIEEFKKAQANLLPRKDKTDEDGAARVTKGMANAFAGMCAILMGYYQEAIAYLGEVINSDKYALRPGEKFGVNTTSECCSEEDIFVARHITDLYTTFDPHFGWDYGKPSNLAGQMVTPRFDAFRVDSQQVFFPEFDQNFGLPMAQLAPTQDGFNKMFENDGESYRFKGTFGQVYTPNGQYENVELYIASNSNASYDAENDGEIGAYRNGSEFYTSNRADVVWSRSIFPPLRKMHATGDGDLEYAIGVPYHILTYPEVLLMYAEAYIKKGNNAEAKKYINMIQERAGSSISSNVNMDVLLNEVFYENYGNGSRWFYLSRLYKNGEKSYVQERCEQYTIYETKLGKQLGLEEDKKTIKRERVADWFGKYRPIPKRQTDLTGLTNQ